MRGGGLGALLNMGLLRSFQSYKRASPLFARRSFHSLQKPFCRLTIVFCFYRGGLQSMHKYSPQPRPHNKAVGRSSQTTPLKGWSFHVN